MIKVEPGAAYYVHLVFRISDAIFRVDAKNSFLAGYEWRINRDGGLHFEYIIPPERPAYRLDVSPSSSIAGSFAISLRQPAP